MAHIDDHGTAAQTNASERHQSHLELLGVMLQDSVCLSVWGGVGEVNRNRRA